MILRFIRSEKKINKKNREKLISGVGGNAKPKRSNHDLAQFLHFMISVIFRGDFAAYIRLKESSHTQSAKLK